eukprot:8050763-Alexandrium_andersonii.AAC.1
MAVNSWERVSFASGTLVPLAGVVKYLGAKVGPAGGSHVELPNRLAAASSTLCHAQDPLAGCSGAAQG